MNEDLQWGGEAGVVWIEEEIILLFLFKRSHSRNIRVCIGTGLEGVFLKENLFEGKLAEEWRPNSGITRNNIFLQEGQCEMT